METKQIQVEMKDEDEGIVTARFATLGVKDLDGDVIEPGAFGNQRVKVSAYGHTSWEGALPVGVGTTTEKGDEATAELKFFMNTTHGRDHFETVKGLGDLGEWSFGFDIEDVAAPTEEQRQAGVNRVLKKLKVHEVSPVLRGAGIGTGTLSVKCDACAAKKGAESSESDDPEAPEAPEANDAPEGTEAKGCEDAEQDEPTEEPNTDEAPDDLSDLVAQATGRVELLRKKMATW